MIRLDPAVQPNMVSGVYFKSWTGSVNGVPPVGGGGAGGKRFYILVYPEDLLKDILSWHEPRLCIQRAFAERLPRRRDAARALVPDQRRALVSPITLLSLRY